MSIYIQFFPGYIYIYIYIYIYSIVQIKYYLKCSHCLKSENIKKKNTCKIMQ